MTVPRRILEPCLSVKSIEGWRMGYSRATIGHSGRETESTVRTASRIMVHTTSPSSASLQGQLQKYPRSLGVYQTRVQAPLYTPFWARGGSSKRLTLEPEQRLRRRAQRQSCLEDRTIFRLRGVSPNNHNNNRALQRLEHQQEALGPPMVRQLSFIYALPN